MPCCISVTCIGLPVIHHGLYVMHEGLPVMQSLKVTHRSACQSPWSVCHASRFACHVKSLSVTCHNCNPDSCMLQRCHDLSMMMSSTQCKHDENMMISCLCHPHAMQTMMMWCSSNTNTNDIMPPHSCICCQDDHQIPLSNIT